MTETKPPRARVPRDARPDENARAASADLAQLGAMGKAFSILETIAHAGAPMTMAELVRASGLTKPTAHRITATLMDMGFIERDQLERGFVEGPRLVDLSLRTLAMAAPRNTRHAVLRSVSDHTGETCNFGILSGAEVIYLDRVESKWPLGLRFEAGSRVPAHCTALGKLLISQLPARDRRNIIATMPLARHTSRTITDPEHLAAIIEEVRQAKIGTDNEEFIDGVVCVSVLVRLNGSQVVGGIAVSAPEARTSLAKLKEYVPMMQHAADRLGDTFSYSEGDKTPATGDAGS
ncbi:MAG: IclR family transcriptional regulator [Pseudomonadota bacterium]